MITILSNKYFLFFSRCILGIVFIISGAIKISNPEGFAQSIIAYRIFPEFLINSIAIFLPWVELISGMLLLLGISVKENSLILIFLIISFILLVFYAILNNLNIECGCFGNKSELVGLQKILQNFCLLFFGINLMLKGSTFLTLNQIPDCESK